MIYDNLKPHIKAKMKENAEEYKSVNWLIDKLKQKDNYSELTIDDIRSLCTFGDVFYNDLTQSQIIWGDWLINK
jgi:iron uptake system EfeUOB component EfeO/EfeM